MQVEGPPRDRRSPAGGARHRRVVGQLVLDSDHPFDVVDGADQGRDQAAPLDLALQHDLTGSDVEEESTRGHHELADDYVVEDLALDGVVGSVEHLQEVAAADDADQPASPLTGSGLIWAACHTPYRLGDRRVRRDGHQRDSHEVAGGGAGCLRPFQVAPLGPDQRDVLVRVGELLLEEQVGLGNDAEHPPGLVHHRRRAHPMLGQPGPRSP